MQSAYGASKACMESLARTWAVELGHKYEVTINTVNPGPVATEMWEYVILVAIVFPSLFRKCIRLTNFGVQCHPCGVCPGN